MIKKLALMAFLTLWLPIAGFSAIYLTVTEEGTFVATIDVKPQGNPTYRWFGGITPQAQEKVFELLQQVIGQKFADIDWESIYEASDKVLDEERKGYLRQEIRYIGDAIVAKETHLKEKLQQAALAEAQRKREIEQSRLRAEQEQADRLAKEKAEKEETERLAKEKAEREEAAKREAQRGETGGKAESEPLLRGKRQASYDGGHTINSVSPEVLSQTQLVERRQNDTAGRPLQVTMYKVTEGGDIKVEEKRFTYTLSGKLLHRQSFQYDENGGSETLIEEVINTYTEGGEPLTSKTRVFRSGKWFEDSEKYNTGGGFCGNCVII